MTWLRLLAAAFAVLVLAGEAARWWGRAEAFPAVLDELLVAGLLAFAAWRGTAVPMLAAWAAWCGFTAALLADNAQHLVHGPAKDGAAFYTALLSLNLAIGLLALRAAWKRADRR
jgi:hypothetical protein